MLIICNVVIRCTPFDAMKSPLANPLCLACLLNVEHWKISAWLGTEYPVFTSGSTVKSQTKLWHWETWRLCSTDRHHAAA